jgi:hypothetical protein
MNGIQKKLVALFTHIMPEETVLTTSIKGLSLFRIERSFPRTPISYNSEIIILAQGEKKVYLGNDIYTYDFSRYLVLPVPLPTECEGWTEPGKPIVGLTIEIDPIEVGETLLNIEESEKESQALSKGIYGAPMNDALYDATARL